VAVLPVIVAIAFWDNFSQASNTSPQVSRTPASARRFMIRLPSNAVGITQVEITKVELPATCYIELVTEGEGGNTSLKQIKLTQQYVTWTILILLGICFMTSVIAAYRTWSKAQSCFGICLNFKLGSPAWDFAKSWTSNISLAGAIISTALTLSALLELTKHASKSGYSSLALLISFAVIIAPFVFIARRTGVLEKDKGPPPKVTVVYQGRLWLFLLSCMITLFAGLAQLVVLSLLLHEVLIEYAFLFFPLAVLLGASLCKYVGYSMFLTIKSQVSADQELTIKAAKGPLLTWPVL